MCKIRQPVEIYCMMQEAQIPGSVISWRGRMEWEVGQRFKKEGAYKYLWLSSVPLLEKVMAPHSVLLPGKSHGQRSLIGCSPWGHEESDMTERLHFHFSLSCTGEGNGNPLQCSCLENPRDGGAWWAAIYGVAESDTTKVT